MKDGYDTDTVVIVPRKDRDGAEGIATILERIGDVVMVLPHWSGHETLYTIDQIIRLHHDVKE